MKRKNLITVIFLCTTIFLLFCSKGNKEAKVDFGNRVLAKVNGKSITKKDFETRLDFFTKAFTRDIPYDNLSDSAKDAFNQDVLEKLIDEKLVTQESRIGSQQIDTNTVNARLNDLKERFGEAYEAGLKKTGKTDSDIKQDIRNGMIVEKWMEKALVINEEEIKNHYDLIIDSLSPEQVRADHILISVPENASKNSRDSALGLATRVRSMINKGGNFNKLAKRYSSCPSAKGGGDLGFMKKGDAFAEFDSVAFALKKGELSEVFTSRHGYHLIRINGTKKKVYQLNEVKYLIDRKLKLAKLDSVVLDLRKRAEIIYFN